MWVVYDDGIFLRPTANVSEEEDEDIELLSKLQRHARGLPPRAARQSMRALRRGQRALKWLATWAHADVFAGAHHHDRSRTNIRFVHSIASRPLQSVALDLDNGQRTVGRRPFPLEDFADREAQTRDVRVL